MLARLLEIVLSEFSSAVSPVNGIENDDMVPLCDFLVSGCSPLWSSASRRTAVRNGNLLRAIARTLRLGWTATSPALQGSCSNQARPSADWKDQVAPRR